MLSDYTKRLREDKRLHRRQGWISSEDLAKQLGELPDLTDKVAPEEEEETPPAVEAEAPSAPEVATSTEQTPVAPPAAYSPPAPPVETAPAEPVVDAPPAESTPEEGSTPESFKPFGSGSDPS